MHLRSSGIRSRFAYVALPIVISALAVLLVTALDSEDVAPCSARVELGMSIQELVDSAEPGSVVCLEAGDYEDNLLITKSLILRGPAMNDGGAVLSNLATTSPVVSIAAPEGEQIDVVIENVAIRPKWNLAGRNVIEVSGEASATLEGVSVEKARRYALVVEDSSTVVTRSCAFTGNTSFLMIRDAANVSLIDTTVEGTDKVVVRTTQASGAFSAEGCAFSGGELDAFSLSGSIAVDINDSSFAMISLTFSGSCSADISSCSVSVNGPYGVMADGEARLTMVGCEITNSNDAGFWLMGSSTVLLDSCTIRDCLESGIELMQETSAEIVNCRITGNTEFGVVQIGTECKSGSSDTNHFKGSVSGYGNHIPGANAPDGNAWGGACPVSLETVLTSP